MSIPAAAVIVPLGLFFFISGLFVNFFQAICFVLVRPFSKNTYRRINRIIAELLWIELVWLVDWWARVQIKVFADAETFQQLGKEHALLVPNHKSDIDWLVGWVLAQRAGCLGSALAVMKKSSKLLPVIGWSMWFSEYLFLERNWAKDESTLKLGFQRLKDYPLPFWLGLFVEGTRFTQAKLQAAQEYAISQGLPVPRNVLIPRTKGFVAAVSHMRSFVPAIYEITVGIPKSSPQPTMMRLVKGQSSVVSNSSFTARIELPDMSSIGIGFVWQMDLVGAVGWFDLVHVHIKRHNMKDLPESDDAVAQWCRDVFIAKDAMLDKHKADDTFGDQLYQDIGRPLKSLVVVTAWAVTIIFGVIKFLQWSALLSSWKGIAISVATLGVITALMQVLIQFSQSERSNPAKVAPAKSRNTGESSLSNLKQDKQH